jgi:Cutinase
MAISSLFLAVMGLSALGLARPVKDDIVLMEEMRVGVDNYIRDFDPVEFKDLVLNVTTPYSPSAGCPDVFMVFTRGTFEPALTANLGMMVGMPFTSALKTALGGKFESIGVDYNNGVMGYLTGGDGPGSKTMAKMISDKVSQCPNSKIIASGYRYVTRLVPILLSNARI